MSMLSSISEVGKDWMAEFEGWDMEKKRRMLQLLEKDWMEDFEVRDMEKRRMLLQSVEKGWREVFEGNDMEKRMRRLQSVEGRYLEYELGTLDLPENKVTPPPSKKNKSSDSDESPTPKSGSSSGSSTTSTKSSDSGCHFSQVYMDDDNVAIYLRTMKGAYNYKWHLIEPKNRTPVNTYLDNILPVEPMNQLQAESACVVVGSRIYILGGLEPEEPKSYFCKKALDDVFFIDTTKQGERRWEKGPCLLRPLPHPFAITINNNNENDVNEEDSKGKGKKNHKEEEEQNKKKKMSGITIFASSPYSVNKKWEPNTSTSPSQILEMGDGVWTSLHSDLPRELYGVITGHVVYHHNGTKRILVHSTESTDLYQYDTTSNQWDVACPNFGSVHPKASALVDGILYSMDSFCPGVVSALDVSSSSQGHAGYGKKKKMVTLVHPCQEKYWWVPQKAKDGDVPDFYMVALGNHKLAFIWSTNATHRKHFDQSVLCIWCTKWKVSKADGDFKLIAISRARYYSDCNKLCDCLAIIQPQEGETQDDLADVSVKGNRGMKHKSKMKQ